MREDPASSRPRGVNGELGRPPPLRCPQRVDIDPDDEQECDRDKHKRCLKAVQHRDLGERGDLLVLVSQVEAQIMRQVVECS